MDYKECLDKFKTFQQLIFDETVLLTSIQTEAYLKLLRYWQDGKHTFDSIYKIKEYHTPINILVETCPEWKAYVLSVMRLRCALMKKRFIESGYRV